MHFNGLFFQREIKFLKIFNNRGIYDISGFGFGTQKAYDEAFLKIARGERVNKLILFSPAFFGEIGQINQSDRDLQINAFKKNKRTYESNLLRLMEGENMREKFIPKKIIFEIQLPDLCSMLNYIWDVKKLETLSYMGVTTEVYLGGKDKTINVFKVSEFFAPYSVIYLFKQANHFLKII